MLRAGSKRSPTLSLPPDSVKSRAEPMGLVQLLREPNGLIRALVLTLQPKGFPFEKLRPKEPD